MSRHPFPEMIVDVLSSSGEVLRQARRCDLGANDLACTVHGFVLFEGEVLLQQLGSSKVNHGRWGSSVAGFLFGGESPIHGIRRRVSQELGCEPSFELRGSVISQDVASRRLITVYASQTNAPLSPVLSEDVEEFRYWETDRLDSALAESPEQFSSHFRHAYRLYRMTDENKQ